MLWDMLDSPVHTDGTQVEDGGGAQHHVHGHQAVTEGGVERPDAVLKLRRAETRVVWSLGHLLHYNLELLLLSFLRCFTLCFTVCGRCCTCKSIKCIRHLSA